MTKAWDRKNTVRYVYDALGRRVSVHGTKGRTKITYDGEDALVDEVDGTLTKYINGPGIDNKLRSQTGTSKSYFLSDHLGSTNGLTDPNGTLTASNTYDSFGNSTNTSFPSRYQFTGRELDSVTGLQFSRARWYDPAIGRFISEDPIGFGGGDVNLYGYVLNRSNHLTDPSGLLGNDYLERLKEAKNRAEQTVIEALETPITFAVGFGDSASGGITRLIRRGQGIEHVNWDCYGAYNAGGWAAIGVEIASGVGGITKAGFKYAGKAAIARVPFTVPNMARGRGVHRLYKLSDVDDITRFKEFTGVRGIRPDFVDFSSRTIYELKPFNHRGIKNGLQQLETYRQRFDNAFPGSPWKVKLEVY